jgi:hypothetical protein
MNLFFASSVLLALSSPWEIDGGNLQLEQSQKRMLASCEDVKSVSDVDAEAFTSAPWFVAEMRVASYQPRDEFNCVEARYTLPPNESWKSLFGWDINVNNYSENDDGTQNEINLCGKVSDEPGQLWVGPCFVPAFLISLLSKPSYWILAYDEEEGYAVISTLPTVDTEDGCEAREGSGFWIFVRNATYTNRTYEIAIEAAKDSGMNIDGLTDFYDVDYSSCNRED